MSLFQNVIGSKTNFVRFDKNNTLIGENTFNGVVNLNSVVNGLEITDIQNLQNELDLKANQTSLDIEETARIGGDTTLQSNIDGLITTLNTEITTRANADNTLQNNIDVVQENVDVVQLNLDNEVLQRLNRDNEISNDLQLETINRQSADTLLSTNLTNEENSRISADNTITANLNLKQPLLNTSDLFLDTSIANQPKLGVGTSTPTSISGGDSVLQIYGQTDCALSLSNHTGNWCMKVKNPSGNLGFYNGGSERGEWNNTELMVKQGFRVRGSVVDMETLPTTSQSGTKLWNNSGIVSIGNQDTIGTLQSNITNLQSSLNTKVDISTLGDYATLVDLADADADLQSSIDTKQPLLNTTALFLDTSVANAVKLGVNISNPTSIAGSDSLIQVYHSVDCGLSLKTNMSDWDIKNRNDGHLTFYKSGSERLTITDTELTVKQGLKVIGSVNFANIPTAPTGLSTGDIWNNSGVLTIIA
jgi:hypothetical protein